MMNSVPMVELWRGTCLESLHLGAAVVCDHAGQIRTAWGNPTRVVLPRSSCKMIQALPLITSGAADTNGLKTEHLALACASHNGAEIHLNPITKWLETLGLKDENFRCGPQMPKDSVTRQTLLMSGQPACQIHNNCSGKHVGFLTLNNKLPGGPDIEALTIQCKGRRLRPLKWRLMRPAPGTGSTAAPHPTTAAASMVWHAQWHGLHRRKTAQIAPAEPPCGWSMP